MRVVYCTPYYKPAIVYGGPVQSISLMCEALARRQEQVTVLTTNANGSTRLDVPLNTPLDVSGVQVVYSRLAPVSLGSFFYSPDLSRAAKTTIPTSNIVVIESLWTYVGIAAARVCKRHAIPYVVSIRGQLNPWALRFHSMRKRAFMKLIGRQFLNDAAALLCTDQSEAVAVKGLGLTPPAVIVSNGLDYSDFAGNANRTWRNALGISEDAKVLLFAGRLHQKKRPDIAVEVLGALKNHGYNVHLIVAGPDEESMVRNLQQLAMGRNCSERFHYVGLISRDALIDAYYSADLFLMPSAPESENFGMSALEALSAGLPILVSEGIPVGNWASAVGIGRTVPCRVEDFTNVALSMLADIPALKKTGARGRVLARAKFDISVLAQQWAEHLAAISGIKQAQAS